MEYLIQYRRSTGDLDVREFQDAREALDLRLQLEQENNDPDLEIVVIGAASLDELKTNHSRYFGLDADALKASKGIEVSDLERLKRRIAG